MQKVSSMNASGTLTKSKRFSKEDSWDINARSRSTSNREASIGFGDAGPAINGWMDGGAFADDEEPSLATERRARPDRRGPEVEEPKQSSTSIF